MLNTILDTPPWALATALASILLALVVVSKISEERSIRALGGRAATYRTYLPFGIDLVYQSVKHAVNHTLLQQWQAIFADNHSHTVEGNAAGKRFIFTDDPENIKAVLATQFHDFGKGPVFHENWSAFLGDSIFTTDLEQWHSSRQLIRPQFLKDRVSDLEVFELHAQKLLDHMGGRGQTVDADKLFFRYTLDAATDFLLGKSVNSLDNPQVEFAEAFSEVQRVQNLMTSAGMFNVIIPKRGFRAGLKVINEFVHPYIERALRLSPAELEKKANDDRYTFLHALASFTRDRKVIRDQLVAVLLAGRDTTAATLSWTFYELSRHPEVVEKLRREISETIGLHRAPSYADLKSMKYLQHTINETLRLYPAVPFNIRVSLHATTLPHGAGPDGLSPVGIPPFTPIGYSPLTMQRREDLYPVSTPAAPFPPAADYNPDRWDTWTPKAWHYIPFNGGPRICVGQQFALAEMSYTVVRILQRFRTVEKRWTDGMVSLKSEVTLQPGGEGVK
ncbi:MAG: hypothetical protein M4579_007453, partial [Chaenotheca gracillima]